jgi:hypothetical protein
MSCPTDYSPLRCRARKIVVELRCCHVGAVFCCTAARPLLAHSGDDRRRPAAQPVAQGIVVSGLVILTDIQLAQYPAHTNPPGGIEKYYRDNVIGGPGSFVMVAEDYNSFGRAMVRKLIAEIATIRSASAEPQARRP